MYLFGTNLCEYSSSLGLPGEGPHELRIPLINLAFVDVFLTFLGAYLLSSYLKVKFWATSVVFFSVAFFLHWAFCVPTTLNVMILGDDFNSSENVSFP